MEPPIRIFVYGTLRRLDGNPMHWLLKGAKFLGGATCGGRLYCVGTYPALIPSLNPTDRVVGEVYELSDPAEVLEVLDEYEGCNPSDEDSSLFIREITSVRLETGEVLEVLTYRYNKPVEDLDRIVEGDFAVWMTRRKSGW